MTNTNNTTYAYRVSTRLSSSTIYARNKSEARDMFRNQYLKGCDYSDNEIKVSLITVK